MFSSLQPARLSLLALLLASFVLAEDARNISSVQVAGAAKVSATNNLVDGLSIRQDTDTDDDGDDSGGLGDLLPTEGTSKPDEPTKTDATPTSATESKPDSTTQPPPTTSKSDDPEPTATPTETKPSPTPSKTADPDPSESSKTTAETAEPTKTDDESVTSDPTVTKGPPESTITSRVTSVADVTSDGKTYQSTMVGTSLIPTNTAAPIDNTPEKSSSMDTKTRNTVIGVVVGVGGAIFLALVFLVFWKFWGRRRAARTQDDDALMMTSPGEKPDTASTANPFQSTLESYHAPQRPVNASSNF
ncbi:hypothetical protein V493_05958 [Pseudogymnoascus sp. VKM F-4281 (FW-2241)]|nr:hypothetical protein V493_05958 [Pseudogymnoascus sp. VKM F-4281 (FW-2241)]